MMTDKSFEKVAVLETSKVGPTKKYAMIGAVVIVISVLIAIGFLVGIYLFTDAFHKIVTTSMQTKENTKQDTSVDMSANIVEYHVNDSGLTAIHVDDYNMLISVVKLTTSRIVVCYVTAMNVSVETDLTKFKIDSKRRIESNEEIVFVSSKVPIADTTFLNRKARGMCKGVPTYWAHPVCPSEAASRRKRGLGGFLCNFICKLFTSEYNCKNYCWIADIVFFFIG